MKEVVRKHYMTHEKLVESNRRVLEPMIRELEAKRDRAAAKVAALERLLAFLDSPMTSEVAKAMLDIKEFLDDDEAQDAL